MGILIPESGQGGGDITLSKYYKRMNQRLLNDDEDHEDNEYNEEYAEEPPKEGVGCVVKIFLILLLIVAVVLVLVPSLIPVIKSIHTNSMNDVNNFLFVEDYQDKTELQTLSLKTRSNSEPLKTISKSVLLMKTGSNSEPVKKTGSDSDSWITKFISDLCAVLYDRPWWVYAVAIVLFVVVGITVWRTCLCLGDVLLAGWILTRARSQGYTNIV